jgi:hypothetical protein
MRWVLLVALLAVLAGCDSGSYPASPSPTPGPPPYTSTTTEPPSTTRARSTPAASIPPEIVGLWQDSQAGSYLGLRQNASYFWASPTGQIAEQGYVSVTRDGSWTFMPINGPARRGTYGYGISDGTLDLATPVGRPHLVRANGNGGGSGPGPGPINSDTDPTRWHPTPEPGPYTPDGY